MSLLKTAYRLRPGGYSDIPTSIDLYIKSFDGEALLDYMFPNRRTDPTVYNTWLTRRYYARYWTPGYFLTMLVIDDGTRAGGHAVGFTWWQQPASSLTFAQRWLSPYAWICPIMQTIYRIRDRFFPIPNCDMHRVDIFTRVFAEVEPKLLNSPRRRDAWYLSSLGVDPEKQGKGFGSLLMQDGLRKVDAAGAASWLIGLRGLENYYYRYGFVEVARANVGELKDWDGGAIMFRGE
ncbi:hypothetical protein G7046_g8961 [Stylonectria norvegica]|nr:hypothetical protein G7046_g8961 [Stylonectria norvegica]